MNSDLELLMNMLSCVGNRGDQHSDFIIKETDKSALLKKVTIKAGNGDWFVFDPDRGRGMGPSAKMSPLLAVGRQYCHQRACDAVLVVLKDEILRLIFIDLKSNEPSGYASQFQSTRQFARYLLGLLNEFKGVSFPNVEERFLLLHTGKAKKPLLYKTPTRLNSIGTTSKDPRNPQTKVVADNVTILLKELMA